MKKSKLGYGFDLVFDVVIVSLGISLMFIMLLEFLLAE